MEVTLLNHTPLWVCSDAIRTCWQSQEKSDTTDEMKQGFIIDYDGNPEEGFYESCISYSHQNEAGEKDKELIDRVGNKNKHASTLEHLTYNFYISGVSRALLQELARHRHASLSVKSTRYTLKELKEEEYFVNGWSINDTFENVDWNTDGYERAQKYLVMTGDFRVDIASIGALDILRGLLQMGISNDKAKYAMPEAYKTELTWTINARSLQNFLSLRTSKAALWEIRDLAYLVFKNIPEEHKYLFTVAEND